MELKKRYSGPDRSGICVCGCRWDRHHLGIVMNKQYLNEVGEGYIPQECETYGVNELGGMKPDKDGSWQEHCFRYVDTMEQG